MKRSWTYAGAGAALGAGSLLGDLLVRWWLYCQELEPLAWLTRDLRAEGFFYAVETGLAVMVLALAGYQLGRVYDRLAKATAALERASTHDSLTGVHNRRSLFDHLEREMARAERRGSPLSCLMVDADRFKEINDRQSHAAGDRALRALAVQLVKSSRTEDLVGRYGGDEFAILLPDTDLRRAVELAERVRRAAEAVPGGVRVSVGAAERTPQTPRGEDLLAAADRALYEAKRAGRNRVAAAS